MFIITSVSTFFGHHYAHPLENKDHVTAFGVLLWFCWTWLVAAVGRCVVGCEHCLLLTSVSTCFGHHYAHPLENKDRVAAFGVLLWFCWMWLVAVVGRCLAGCEHCEVEQKPSQCSHPTTQLPTTATNHSHRTRAIHQMQ